MPHYVTLVRYTSQGISKIKDSPSRLDAARKAAEAEGGKIQTWYLTMGQYDAVLISEFPSDEACAKFTLSASALGNISTETLKAFPSQVISLTFPGSLKAKAAQSVGRLGSDSMASSQRADDFAIV